MLLIEIEVNETERRGGRQREEVCQDDKGRKLVKTVWTGEEGGPGRGRQEEMKLGREEKTSDVICWGHK